MNIFVTDMDPRASARVLPDKHIVKMPLECCQMLSIIYSPWYYNWGTLPRADGKPYETKKGAFRNHPCTQWAAKNIYNTAWLISHGIALSSEYNYRYDKIHTCNNALFVAKKIFHKKSKKAITCWSMADDFARAMPDEWKHDDTIDTITAYKKYIASKPWAPANYLRKPERKPAWM